MANLATFGKISGTTEFRSRFTQNYFSYAKDIYLSVYNFQGTEHLYHFFHLPLLDEAYSQYQELQSLVQNIFFEHRADQWLYLWGSSTKAYRHLIGHRTVHQAYRWLWKSFCQNKQILLLVGPKRPPCARNLHRRTNMNLQDYSCVHCANLVEETLIHLLVNCPFAVACWNTLNLNILIHDDFLQVIISFKDQIWLPFYMEIMVTMCWSI